MKNKLVVLLTGFFLIILSISNNTKAQVMDNQALTPQQQSIIKIAAFTASGNLDKLKPALIEGLDVALTVNEINEVLIQVYAYAGFPRSLNGITTFMEIVAERKNKGITDTQGKEAIPLAATVNKSEYGEKIRTELAGTPTIAAWQTFAPGIELFLKEHLFADIFARDILDYQTRELVTVAILASISGVNPQLQSHMTMAMNTGLTKAQLTQLVTIIEVNVGTLEGQNARKVLLVAKK